MSKVSEIISKIEELAPVETAEDWDNTGWQINLGNKSIKRVLLALSPTPDVIDQAADNGCDLIITHHPLIFGGIKKLNNNLSNHKSIIKAVQNNIQIYSAHSNLDKASGGINDIIAALLEVNIEEKIDDLVIVGTYKHFISMEEFVNKVKNVLNVEKIKLINHAGIISVKRVAVCGGSGADYINKLKDIDIFVTGDVKYHNAIDALDFAIVDAGHYETERPVLEPLKSLINNLHIDCLIAEEREPWEIL